MAGGLQLSAKSVANLLARIYGPSIYDAPPYGEGDLRHGPLTDLVRDPSPEPWKAIRGPLPDPWSWVMLNPQPLPPGELQALALADAHVQELLGLDRLGSLWGGEIGGRAEERALRLIAESDELCPRWPRWPKTWPPPPRPPRGWDEEMLTTELFVFGSRLLAATDLFEREGPREALTALGEKALSLSMRGG